MTDNVKSNGLEEAVAQVQEVSSLPHIVVQVLQVVNSPRSSAGDLKAVVETDPSLSARVLRRVNSAAYALRSNVNNVQQAIGLLGFNVVRNLAMTATVADMFKREAAVENYSRKALWRHLVSVGVVARLIAARCGIRAFEDAFLAGLLHDIGIIFLDQYLHESFLAVLRSQPANRPLHEAEQAILRFTHAELGAAVAEKWRFPETAVAGIRFHHRTELCPENLRPIVRAVDVANYICNAKGLSAVSGRMFVPPSTAALHGLGIGRDDFTVLWEDVDKELEMHQGLVTI